MISDLLRAVYHASFRAVLPLRCALADWRKNDATLPPGLLRFRVSESLSEPVFLNVGQRCSWIIESAADLNATRRVLDFGCGCGRTLRWLLQSGYKTEFHGVDVDRQAIEWCARNYSNGHFAVNEPRPPLPFPDRHFDLVYCLSVFTHLDEPMQDAWLNEMRRVLAPGGVLLFSVHGERAAAQLRPEIAVELARAGFVHKRSRKLKGILPDWYHTTLHTPEYLEQRLDACGFAGFNYEVIEDGIQNVVTARRL